MAQLRPTTREDHYHGVWSKYSPSFYSGFLGCWYVRINTSEGKALRGLRVWKRIDAPAPNPGLSQWNVYGEDIRVLNPKQRQQDGNYDHQFQYPPVEANEAKYDPVIRDTPPAENRLLRILPGEAVVSLPATLPAQPSSGGAPPGGPWFSEVFMRDGPYRWSALLGYLPTGALMSTSLISEVWHELDDPGAALDFNTLPVPEQRPKLPEDATEWLPKESWRTGTASALRVQPDGSIWTTTQEQPASTWDPAALTNTPGTQLVLLPDSMYMCFPATLPGGPDKSFRCEFGGRMRQNPQCLQRLVLTYGASGRLESVVNEQYGS